MSQVWTSEAIAFLRLAEYPRTFADFTFLRQRDRDLLASVYAHPFAMFAELVVLTKQTVLANLVSALEAWATRMDGEHGFSKDRALMLLVVVLNKLDACGFRVTGITMLEELLGLTSLD